MKHIIADFEQFREDVECTGKSGRLSDTAAAILVLACAIERSATFNPCNAENFGHELALALKNVLKNESFQVSVDGTIRTED